MIGQPRRIIEQGDRITQTERAAYIRKVNRILDKVDTLDVATTKAAAVQVRQLRRQILDSMGSPEGWTATAMPRILKEISQAFDAWGDDLTANVHGAMGEAYKLGNESSQAFAVQAGAAGASVMMINTEQLATLRTITAELLVTNKDKLKADVSRQVRSAFLGVQKPGEAIAAVSRIVPGIRQPVRDKDGEVIGLRYTGPAARAETIVRTELGRAFSVAQHDQLLELDKIMPDARKQWLTVIDGRTRQTHLAAHGQRVKVAQNFIVGGARLMYPRDPSGPASEVINCRCSEVPWRESWGQLPLPLRRRPTS